MPLFHIHGLVAATLASVAAGARIACMPGFYAPHFLDWLQSYQPTWYTAVPTMHRAVLERAKDHAQMLAGHQLRFVRSSSAALPPKLMGDLEHMFGVPVIEAYGMTEASHQIASNPLPPHERKAGSVGRATGVQISIMNQAGKLLQRGTQGEVVIRGQSVTRGYERNSEANLQSFIDGWFHTGDLGHLDSDGYLFVTGRIKEIINRGGQKISPREVDEILIDHPAVYQAAAFAVPNSRLGEDIAAAVVLSDGFSVMERELRAFVAERVADFKVPRRVLIVDEIPKGPTGKLQRADLAEKLGLTSRASHAKSGPHTYIPPRNAVEEALARVWSEVLDVEQVGIHDRFLDLGGDSMLATLILSRVQEWLENEISMIDFFDAPTVAQQALLVGAALIEEIEKERSRW